MADSDDGARRVTQRLKRSIQYAHKSVYLHNLQLVSKTGTTATDIPFCYNSFGSGASGVTLPMFSGRAAIQTTLIENFEPNKMISHVEMGPILMQMAPDLLPQKSLVHFTQRVGPCGYRVQITDGTALLDSAVLTQRPLGPVHNFNHH